MKILLDNCVHEQVAEFFPSQEVTTAAEMGWAGLTNGELLAEASPEFDVLVTTDKNIRYQQNLGKLPIAVIELNSRDTRIEALELLAPYVLKALRHTRSYLFVALYPDGRIEALAKRSKRRSARKQY